MKNKDILNIVYHIWFYTTLLAYKFLLEIKWYLMLLECILDQEGFLSDAVDCPHLQYFDLLCGAVTGCGMN